jgi:hypothetical protein
MLLVRKWELIVVLEYFRTKYHLSPMAEEELLKQPRSYEIYLYTGAFTPGQFMLWLDYPWLTLPIHEASTYH